MKRESLLCGKYICPALLLIFFLCIYPVKACALERATVISNVLNETFNVKLSTRSHHSFESESKHVNHMQPEDEALKKMVFDPLLFTVVGYNNATGSCNYLIDISQLSK
jgi:hypothetical protein